MINKILINGRSFFLLLLALILSLYAAWMVNVQVGYGYSWLYDFYDTEQHITRYAPQNKFREGFETTSVMTHKKVFQQIVDSVHSDGKGLGVIKYEFQGQAVPLLHKAEIIHLQDVANLINYIHYLAWACVGVFLLGVFFEYRHRRKSLLRASFVGQLATFVTLSLIVLAVFLVWGAKAIFYQMHVMIFPADHQWFFYYQDSLMSTLMKAPDLFAGIALQIVILGLMFYALALVLMRKLLKGWKTVER
jgi:hypothetical protein